MQILTLVYLSPAVCRVDHSLSYHSNSNLSDLCLPIYCAVIRKWVGFTSRIFLQVLPTMCTDSLHWLSVSPSHHSTDSRAGRHSSQSGHYTLLLQLISHNTTTNVSKCLVSVEEEIEGSFILSASGLQCSAVQCTGWYVGGTAGTADCSTAVTCSYHFYSGYKIAGCSAAALWQPWLAAGAWCLLAPVLVSPPRTPSHDNTGWPWPPPPPARGWCSNMSA